MSFDIGSVGPAQVDAVHRAMMAAASGGVSAAPVTAASAYASASSGGGDDFAVQVQLASAAEPLGTQLGDQIPQAAQAYEQLAASGHYIHFQLAGQSGTLQIELQDSTGATLGQLAPSGVLRVAAGESIT